MSALHRKTQSARASRCLTLKRAEREYDVSISTWRRWIAEGRLSVIKVVGSPQGRLLLDRQEVEQLIAVSRDRRGA